MAPSKKKPQPPPFTSGKGGPPSGTGGTGPPPGKKLGRKVPNMRPTAKQSRDRNTR